MLPRTSAASGSAPGSSTSSAAALCRTASTVLTTMRIPLLRTGSTRAASMHSSGSCEDTVAYNQPF